MSSSEDRRFIIDLVGRIVNRQRGQSTRGENESYGASQAGTNKTDVHSDKNVQEYKSRKTAHERFEERFWIFSGVISIATGAAAIYAAIYASRAFEQAKLQTADIKRQADAITTPYIYASAISHEDTSKEAYFSKPEPLFNLSGFDVSIDFTDFGQAPGVVYKTRCAVFFGYGLKHINEKYFAKFHPDIAVKIKAAAEMNFWRPIDGGQVIIVPAANSGKSEELVCSHGVENAAGFGVNSGSSGLSIAEFIARRGYYLKVAFKIEGKETDFNECFSVKLPSIPSKGLSFQRKRDDCEDWN